MSVGEWVDESRCQPETGGYTWVPFIVEPNASPMADHQLPLSSPNKK